MIADKPKYAVGCSGHINLSRIKDFKNRESDLRSDISRYFQLLKGKYSVTLYSGLANGADSVFAEEALKCGIAVVAVLPEDVEAFKNEQKDRDCFTRLYNSTSGKLLCKNGYIGVMDKLIELCDEIVTLWDGVELPLTDENGREINRGGTYDVVRTAKQNSKKVTHFNRI